MSLANIDIKKHTPEITFGGGRLLRDTGDSRLIKFTKEDGSNLQQLGTLLGTSKNDKTNLDWALVRITNKGFRPIHNLRPVLGDALPATLFAGADKDIPVVTCTGSREASTGVMYGPSTFLKMAGSQAFQEVRTVKLDGNISK